MYESYYVIKTEINFDKEKCKICTAKIWSSKNDNRLKTGDIIDVTDFKNKLMR